MFQSLTPEFVKVSLAWGKGVEVQLAHPSYTRRSRPTSALIASSIIPLSRPKDTNHPVFVIRLLFMLFVPCAIPPHTRKPKGDWPRSTLCAARETMSLISLPLRYLMAGEAGGHLRATTSPPDPVRHPPPHFHAPHDSVSYPCDPMNSPHRDHSPPQNG